ncbi:MAG TPA: transporter substrate-binding domain-containing protein, partial [Dongiaceae bacterium]
MSHMLRNAVAGLAALVAVSAGSATAQEQSKLDEVLARGKLIVGTGSTNAPWHFKDESGNLVGFDIDIAKIIAKGLFNDDTKVEFVDQASDARIPNVTTGKVDITCQFMTVTAERAQQVAFTIPYYREGVALLVSADGKYKTYDDLKKAGSGATISVLQNAYAEDMV